jgi:hypothetical protein
LILGEVGFENYCGRRECPLHTFFQTGLMAALERAIRSLGQSLVDKEDA